jgi:hypothetical protein
MIDALIVFCLWTALTVLILAVRVDRLRKWKKRIEGATSGEWASEKQFQEFKNYFFDVRWDFERRIRNLENEPPPMPRRRLMIPSKWKPWV